MVLVKFRTVNAKLYKIELPADANISQAKEEVSKEISGTDPSKMKLIYKAKVLNNDVPISSLKLGEKDFIVVNAVQSKPKPAPAAQPETKPTAEPLPTEAPKPTIPEAQPLPTMQAAPQPAVPPQANFEDALKSLTEMGFDHDVSAAALRVSGGNPDIAAELIITGQIGGGNGGSDQNSEDEAENAAPEAPANAPEEPLASPEQAQLPQGLSNVPPDQAAETLLAAFPQEEQDAIHRLQQLGNFNILEVIQIYHACEKNEELAANILLSGM